MTNQVPDQEKPQLNGYSSAESVAIEEDLVNSPVPQTHKDRQKWLSGGRGLLLGIGIGVAIAVGGTRLVGSNQADSPPEAVPDATSQAQARTVTTTEVDNSPVNRTLEASGSVSAFELTPVTSQASGLQIQQVLVDEGEFVKAGQLMARLDDSLLQAQLRQAKASVAEAEARLAQLQAGARLEEIAQAKESVRSAEAQVAQAQSDLALARKRVQRNRMLATEGAIARDRLDEVLNEERSNQLKLEQAQANLREAQQRLAQQQAGTRKEEITQAEAQLAQAKAQQQAVLAQLKDTRVLAPVSGKVAQRNAKVGDITSSSEKLYTIIDNGRLELLLKVPETELSQISNGQNVLIKSDADSSLRLTGKVREIDPLVDEESRLATVKVDLPAVESLRPGMFLQAAIVTSKASGLTVPSKAVLPQSESSAIVYRLKEDNTVEAQEVELGEILPGERVEIKSGLEPGDIVIVKGAPYLNDGDLVETTTSLSI